MLPIIFRRVVNLQITNTRTLLFPLVLVAAAGCEGNRTATGPDAAGPVAPASAPAVRLEGRIIGERDEPVSGAVVTATDFCAPAACTSVPGSSWVSQPTDDQGAFVLTTNLPLNWSQVNVRVTRDGFEPSQSFFLSTEAASVVLRLLPRLTIRPGQSIETQLFLNTYFCGDEGWICRRIVVESAPDESMDLEVFRADGQDVGLIVGPPLTHPISPTPPRRVTMTSGEVWLYGAVGRVTVKARRR